TPGAAALYLLENLALLTGLTGTPAMICVTWTLSYELLLYIALPLVVRFTGMRDWSRGKRIGALAVALIGYLAYCGVISPAHARLIAYLAGFLAYEVIKGTWGRL